MYTIAIDAMGGDYAPQAVIEAVNQVIKNHDNIKIKLYGDQEEITKYIQQSNQVEVIHAEEIITGEDEPVKAIRQKKQASVVLAARAVKEGQADALLSAGNTGALLTAGLLIVGRIPNVDRPALMPIIPTISKQSPRFILMDGGANADLKAENLVQFAILANVYAQKVMHIEHPRIGLINNGTEAGKGNHLTKEVYQLLKELDNINFVGNIETKNLLEGIVDIAISDGFTGNAVLKTIEGTAKSILTLIKDTLMNSGLKTKIGGALIKSSLKNALTILDDSKHGGAVLLGVKAPVIKVHGSANSQAIYRGILQAQEIVDSQAIEIIQDYFKN